MRVNIYMCVFLLIVMKQDNMVVVFILFARQIFPLSVLNPSEHTLEASRPCSPGIKCLPLSSTSTPGVPVATEPTMAQWFNAVRSRIAARQLLQVHWVLLVGGWGACWPQLRFIYVYSVSFGWER